MAKKTKIKWNIVAPFAVGVLLCVYLVVSIIVSLVGVYNSQDHGSITTICTYNKKQTLAAVDAEDKENPIGLADYNFYGESLNLYFDDYEVASSNSIVGRTIVLRDMCNGDEIEITEVSGGVDNMIDLASLEEGYYAVYIKTDETYQRVYMESKITSNNTFTTVVRDGKALKVELIADTSYFNTENAEEDYLDRNYLYISVTEVDETELEADEYDIVIVTAPALTVSNVSLVGEEADGTSEAAELWNVAEEIAQQLTDAGYRVTILKETYDENIQYYGSDGVLGRAYDVNAKYMIYLDMSIADSVTGVYYSSYADGVLAQAIFDELYYQTSLYAAETKLTASKTELSSYIEDGIYYDSNYEIREAGGAVLGAGVFSESSTSNSFASSNIYGINTIKIVTNNIKDSDMFTYFIDNESLIASAIVDGIMNYLN